MSRADELADELSVIANFMFDPRPKGAVIGARDELRRLSAVNAELLADATRYRWLRQNSYLWPKNSTCSADEQDEEIALWHKRSVPHDGIDAAIDAAIQKAEEA